MTSQQIRQQFIDFFVQRHGHTFVPSSPVVPHDDPTLLFTNAGMNQFKPIFLGTERRSYTRAVNTQKCIRAGGKHNDLDDVGRSRRHHTFFEMLGNWSFGDYFKQGAIEMAWELLTKVWKLDPTRLHVTVHAGDEEAGVPRDEEAAQIWKRVANLPDDRIHYGPTKDNFWEMGPTGPCGPCTEIFIDRTPDKSGGPTVLSGEDPRVMEIWNNVFIQYNRNPDKSLSKLPAQHVDTGMGFERITQVLQGKDDNFAIDLWEPIFAALTDRTGIRYAGKFTGNNTTDPAAEAADAQLRHDIAFRVIADHLRAVTFAIIDGAVPDNKGRGSTLRGIIRRAARFGWQQLGLREPFFHSLVPVLVDTMGDAFPELRNAPKRVMDIVRSEEDTFGRTIERGLSLFNEAADRAKDGVVSGLDTFHLHTTYGFFPDLTNVMAAERGLKVDEDEYKRLFKKFQQDSGVQGDTNTALLSLPPDALAKLESDGVAKTDDSAKFNAMPIGATVRGIWDGSKLLDKTHGAEAAEQGVAVVLDQTNFYAEMGGQVGDTGQMRSKTGAVFDVTTTRATGGYVLHVGRMVEGHLSVGDHVTATLAGVRPRTEKNHTATHLANWALREVLGEGVQQKGSLVDPDKLRFDFSHGKALGEDELARIEQLVAERIGQKLPVYAEEAPQEQALKINGLRAVFGEKYPPMVRVVSIGVPVADLLKNPSDEKWRQFSVEFCGGTHLKSTADVESFAITAEEYVSKGIRRIVALTGNAASMALGESKELLGAVDKARSAPESELATAIGGLQKQLGAIENIPLRVKRRVQAAVTELQAKLKAWEKAQQKAAAGAGVDAVGLAGKLLDEATPLSGGPAKLVVGEIPGAAGDQLFSAADSIKKKAGSYAVMLASAADGKVNFVAAVSDDLIAKGLKAGDWIREVAKVAGGGGGGRPQMAQAGGKDPSKLPDALSVAREYVAKTVMS
jgi:alanyl-tRNA synthetase